jgi:hypothetical protein
LSTVVALLVLTLLSMISAVALAAPDPVPSLSHDAIVASSSAVDENDKSSGHSSSRSFLDHEEDSNATPSLETKPAAGVVVTGEVVACAECSNLKDRLPELWSFLVEGEIDFYHGVTKTWTTSGSPQVILTVYRGGRYADSIVLNDDDAWTRREYHQVMRSNGFRLKDATGRKAAREAAEKEIREEAAWRRYRHAYHERRDRHVQEFRSRVMAIDPSAPDCPSNNGCIVASSAGGGRTTTNLPTPILEGNFNKNNRRGYLYAKTGRRPKKKQSNPNGNQPAEPNAAADSNLKPKANGDRDSEFSHRQPTSAQPSSKSHLPLNQESPPNHLILQQRKAEIKEKLRAITRKRIVTTLTPPGSSSTPRCGRRRRYRLSSRRKREERRPSPVRLTASDKGSMGSDGAKVGGGSDGLSRPNRRPQRRPTSRGRVSSSGTPGRRKALLAAERAGDFKDAFVMSIERHQQKSAARERTTSTELQANPRHDDL